MSYQIKTEPFPHDLAKLKDPALLLASKASFSCSSRSARIVSNFRSSDNRFTCGGTIVSMFNNSLACINAAEGVSGSSGNLHQ